MQYRHLYSKSSIGFSLLAFSFFFCSLLSFGCSNRNDKFVRSEYGYMEFIGDPISFPARNGSSVKNTLGLIKVLRETDVLIDSRIGEMAMGYRLEWPHLQSREHELATVSYVLESIASTLNMKGYDGVYAKRIGVRTYLLGINDSGDLPILRMTRDEYESLENIPEESWDKVNEVVKPFIYRPWNNNERKVWHTILPPKLYGDNYLVAIYFPSGETKYDFLIRAFVIDNNSFRIIKKYKMQWQGTHSVAE